MQFLSSSILRKKQKIQVLGTVQRKGGELPNLLCMYVNKALNKKPESTEILVFWYLDFLTTLRRDNHHLLGSYFHILLQMIDHLFH